MARLFTEGFESGDMQRWSTSTWSAVSTAQKRTGNYSGDSANNGAAAIRVLPSTYTEFYARLAIRVSDNTSSLGTSSKIMTWSNGASEAGSLRMPTIGAGACTLTMYDGTTLRATSSLFSLLANEWHVLEIHVKIAASPNGVFEAKIDGTTVLSWTGATNNQAAMDRFTLLGHQGAGGTDTFYDDIAFNDTSGGVDNSWIGDGGVLAALVPNGAGNYTDLIASAGSAYTDIDEIPANTTDYVYESTVNKKSTYTMTDLAGLPSGAAIARVWVEVDALETSAAGDKIATLLRSGATDSQGADQALTVAYARYLSAEYLTDPQDSATWTATKVNALEAGCVVR